MAVDGTPPAAVAARLHGLRERARNLPQPSISGTSERRRVPTGSVLCPWPRRRPERKRPLVVQEVVGDGRAARRVALDVEVILTPPCILQ